MVMSVRAILLATLLGCTSAFLLSPAHLHPALARAGARPISLRTSSTPFSRISAPGKARLASAAAGVRMVAGTGAGTEAVDKRARFGQFFEPVRSDANEVNIPTCIAPWEAP